MNKNYNDLQWKEIYIAELFDTIFIAKSSDSNALVSGDIPFIGRSNLQNGLQSEYNIDSDKIVSGNVITIAMVGNPKAFYQEFSFGASQNILVLSHKKLNKYNALFLVSILDNYLISKGYNYGYPLSLGRVKRDKIMIPIDYQGNPDFLFMEQYIKSIYHTKKMNKNVIRKSREKLQRVTIPKLEDKEWDVFFLTNIFSEIKRGRRLTKARQINGNTPYISSTSFNNGVDNFISNTENVRIFNNCITIANSGSVGSTFYHPYEFIASDHITHLKNNEMNEYVYLFIATLTRRFTNKYNFNLELNDKRISREKILLPIDHAGAPDYKYMEQFIINVILDKVSL